MMQLVIILIAWLLSRFPAFNVQSQEESSSLTLTHKLD